MAAILSGQKESVSRPEAEHRIGQAYQAVFLGQPTKDDQEIVLMDLANYTGFYRVTGPGGTPDQMPFDNGKRAAFGRVFRFLRMSNDEFASLEAAARETAVLAMALAQDQN